MISQLLDHWQLSDGERSSLVALPFCVAPLNSDQWERVRHMLRIHANLRTLFPRNLDLAYRWIGTPNAAFGDNSPIRVIQNSGLDGLRAVVAYLDALTHR
ncbi:MAG: MbcA/ParS/Xre antitoxin family protein [Casimicrobium sp.]